MSAQASGLSVQDRVYAAAESISAEQNPTVSRVRETAGVSNADATRYLKAWRQERAAAGSQVTATPQAVLEHAARLAGTLWADAVRVAGSEHAAVQAQWKRESQDREKELAELVADLDRGNTERNETVTAMEKQIAALQTQIETAESRARDAETAAAKTGEQLISLAADLAAERARADTLQQAHTALLERISPEKQTP